ncbi:MAG: penicillin-binding protein 2 [Spirochaetaceae bacterium 4572_59]|nr:MAG: penicillin-binding protein 2 [Spirochaetaceae bacterium 4572_59]
MSVVHHTKINRSRVYIFAGIMLIIMIIYTYKLFSLQIVDKLIYEKKAKEVSQRSKVIPSQRGRIYDRWFDVPLVMNVDSFAINYTSANADDENVDELISRLSKVMNLSEKDIKKRLPGNRVSSYIPVEISDGVSYETVVKIAENIDSYKGISWTSKPKRFYNYTGSISHVLGYVGNITNEELQILYNQGYTSASVLGKNGIEKQYDHILRGENGRIYNTVDARGRRMSDQGSIQPPENGYDLILTIDRHIQELAEKALGPRKGSVVVLDPATGEIVALVSYPGFNPNLFNTPGPGNFGVLSMDPDFPFLNRAIQSSYAPASTFKVLLTAAALQEEVIDDNYLVNCTGSMELGNRLFYCHKRTGHGNLNLKEALAESCNVFFGTLGVEFLGIDIIAEYAKAFGFGSLSLIDLQGEVPGNIPTPAWKNQTYNSPWTGGDTLNASIGQGFVAVTPLQLANMIAAIINDGDIYKPHILKSVINPTNGSVVETISPEILRTANLDKERYQILREYLRNVVTNGTSNVVILNDQVAIAGKTGTGEVGSKEHWHSWFASYGPWTEDNEGPKYVVITMSEASNDWDWWAPKAADIIYQGIFGHQTYEEVIEYMHKRGVWYARDIHLETDVED